ncbi:hypothetical protein J7E74_32910 [Rhodococcus erythropolis]|nr:hypothetical protein [Rhodococcus erythropolis]
MANRTGVKSPWSLYKSLSYGHLGPSGQAYYFYVVEGRGVGRPRPRDVDGYPVLSLDAPQVAVEYARARGFPLPGENDPIGDTAVGRAARRQERQRRSKGRR